MFFALSKTLGVALLPTNFSIALGLVGFVLLATRRAALGRKLMAAAIVLLALCAFSPLGSLLLYPLETRFPPWDASRGTPNGIVVLGGPLDADLSAAHGRPVVHSAADRMFAAAELARRYPNARIVFTGGSPNLVSNDAKEADYAATLLEALGIDRQRMILERQSRNTLENAVFTKALVAPKPGERWLLVTSAYHMPRSVGLFRKAGFPVEAYPVDWRIGDQPFAFTPVALDGLSRTDTAIREWMGLFAYRLWGRTGELLPGPAKD
ncbi:YdcF family protein [Bradyrhizobium sp.]|uniref:YdcF family protein n=1 Tax=Bradyrhizobium sp. TaxID=376 RepID=UPI00262FFE50|nr:YdcF family protein [Bradyrhizobium sp.]